MDVMKRSQKRHSLVEISRIKWLQDSNPRPSSQFEFSSVFTVALSVLKVDSLQAVPSVLVFSGPINGYRQAAQNMILVFSKLLRMVSCLTLVNNLYSKRYLITPLTRAYGNSEFSDGSVWVSPVVGKSHYQANRTKKLC